MLTVETTENWLKKLGQVYAEQKDYLTELDSKIGDADHGINMNRGFSAVCAELDKQPPASISAALKSAAMVLIRTVGGASGPLYGSFFLDFSKALEGKETVATADAVAAFRAGLESVKKTRQGTGWRQDDARCPDSRCRTDGTAFFRRKRLTGCP